MRAHDSSTDDPLIAMRDIEMTFGDAPPTLSGINVSFQRGEFVSIIGPSGCGKSTLLRIVAGLLTPTGGSLSAEDAAEKAFVFQEPTLLPWRSVLGNIGLPLELRGCPSREIEQAVSRNFQLVGLSPDDAAKRPKMLSGGMRMRVSLARALVTEPDLMLLDEPFAALDDMMRQRLNEDLLRLWTANGWTGLFVTHNVAEAVFLSQRVLVMSAQPGQISHEVIVPFDYPRSPDLRGESEFAKLTRELSNLLRGVGQ